MTCGGGGGGRGGRGHYLAVSAHGLLDKVRHGSETPERTTAVGISNVNTTAVFLLTVPSFPLLSL